MKKVYLLIGGAVGFVLGSRAGRGPYEQLEAKVRKTANRPEVQSAVDQAKSTAMDQAAGAAKTIGDKLPGSARESESPASSTAAAQEQATRGY